VANRLSAFSIFRVYAFLRQFSRKNRQCTMFGGNDGRMDHGGLDHFHRGKLARRHRISAAFGQSPRFNHEAIENRHRETTTDTEIKRIMLIAKT
jgi:hypothetical protein